ncbi:MAG: hypothetical protein U0787_12645 [Polyangia bacterium]
MAQPPADDLQAAGWPLDIDARFAKIVLRCDPVRKSGSARRKN